MTEEKLPEPLKRALEGIDEKSTIGIFTHRFPDPDAVASMMALKWIVTKLTGVTAIDLIYDGKIAHPQNQVFDNILEPGLKLAEDMEDLVYTRCFLVDTVPSNAGVDGHDAPKWDLVIDHHKEPSTLPDNYINVHAGSCAATIYMIMEGMGLDFDVDNEIDRRTAVAILVGIATDTEMLCAPETTKVDVEAWSSLLDKRDPDALQAILKYKKPKLWVEKKAEVFGKVQIREGNAVVGIGRIDAKHRDLIADIADDIRSWEEVNTAVVFALIEGTKIEGSVRSINSGLSVPNLCKALGQNQGGQGGGKTGKGAYNYALGGASITLDDSEEVATETWKLFEKKESERIFRTIKS